MLLWKSYHIRFVMCSCFRTWRFYWKTSIFVPGRTHIPRPAHKRHLSIIPNQDHKITISQLKNVAFNINFVLKYNTKESYNFAPTAIWKWKKCTKICALELYSTSLKLWFTWDSIQLLSYVCKKYDIIFLCTRYCILWISHLIYIFFWPYGILIHA